MSATPRTTIIHHADCIDGFGAAYAAWRQFGDTAVYRPLHHGENIPLAEIAGHDVFILDFSLSPAELEAMASHTASLTQIDHHASARSAWHGRLQRRPDGSEVFSHPELPLHLTFDLHKSGARLAWEHFHPEQPLPLLLQHIEDQDLWRFALEGTSRLCRALRLEPFDFTTWDALVNQTPGTDAPRYRELLHVGSAIEQFCRAETERLAGSRLRMRARLRGEAIDPLQAVRHGQIVLSDGENAWQAVDAVAINASALFASELGHQLAEQGEIGLIWQLAEDGEAKVSLRSRGQRDVAAIAMRYGGGGHRNAAGFRMPLKRFMQEVLGRDC